MNEPMKIDAAGHTEQSGRRYWKGLGVGASLAALLGAVALLGGPGIHGLQAETKDIASAREISANGIAMGQVEMYKHPVLRIRSASGGSSGFQRAKIVAGRINRLSSEGELKNIHVTKVNGEDVVVAGNGAEIITASQESSRTNGTTPYNLASTWAQNIRGNIRSYAYSGRDRYGAPEGPDTEHTADKLVPILSAGTGIRVGAALVTGPSSRVAQVAAVGQLEDKYKNIVSARILVPVSNPAVTGGLTRVPEVSVYAVGNYRL